ncbi:hypothetical protein [Sulfurimonas sp.]|uniref:hypothetical protein n=1 Tax=Sulfurimonas sp. TaxID=2022749 RepID=UPI0019E3288E|nr:hypothetical protein [Sulfurimonas sp.]MBE0515225.1 hypothetical protein [Sulfurimonas sp.]
MSLRVMALLSCLLLNIYASEECTFEQYVDEKHKKFSRYVVKVFDNVDKSISRWVQESDDNETSEDETLTHIDKFFKDEKFIEETQMSFLRLRLGSEFQSKADEDYRYKIRAQIPLNRTKKSFQLFIEDVEKNYFDPESSTEVKERSTAVGINFFAPVYKEIKSKYSIGISSFTPYAKARYSKDFKLDNWIIQPTQQFKYSLKTDWSEETNLYFNRALVDERSLFRTTLYRKTQSHVDGFDYAVTFSYYLTLSSKKGFSISQQFWGNSKYKCEVAPQNYNGISNYSTSVSWRQNVFKQWISLELGPGISFHRQYGYEPNYVFQFNVDFYFGNI